MPGAFGVASAILSGILYALAANITSYTASLKAKGNDISDRKNLWVHICSFVLFGIGGLLMTAAYASGDSVAFINAAMMATNLLFNMIFQMSLEINIYSKSMRFGTTIFLVAVVQLSYVGPSKRGEVDIKAMFTGQEAIAWFLVLASLAALSLIGIASTQNRDSGSFVKIGSWSMGISCLACIADNAASSFGLLQGWPLVAVVTGYVLLSIIVLGASSKAPGVCNAAVYVPAQLCLQLVLNMCTGMFVWSDAERTPALPPYLACFALCIISVGLLSEDINIWHGMRLIFMIRRNKLSEGYSSGPLGTSLLELKKHWEALNNDLSPQQRQVEENSAKASLKESLIVALSLATISHEDIVDLCMLLHEDRGNFAASAAFVRWVESQEVYLRYVSHDPKFINAFRALLTPSERARLQTLKGGVLSETDSEDSDVSDI